MDLRPRFLIPCSAFIVSALLTAMPSRSTFAQEKAPRTETTKPVSQPQTIADEKRSRTPAQKKIDSQLLYAIKQKRGELNGLPVRIEIKVDTLGRTIVDITSAVPTRLVSKIKKLGGEVISVSEKYHTVRALLALDKLEALASSKEVRFISPPARAMTHGGAVTN